MNLAVISGRTTKDFETFTSKTGTMLAKTNIAVDSGFGDNKRTDFIPITVFGKQAEFCSQYVTKGDLVEVKGHIVTGSYKKSDGTTVYTTDVNADDIKKLQGNNKNKAEFSSDIASTQPLTPFEEINEQIPF